MPYLCKHTVFAALCYYKERWFDSIACDAIRPAVHERGCAIFSVGQLCNAMHFVSVGKFKYEKRSKAVLDLLAGSFKRQLFGMNATYTGTSLLTSEKLAPGTYRLGRGDHICEPVLWCDSWYHCGDLTAPICGMTLELAQSEVANLVVCNPRLKQWAMPHALRFVKALNRYEPSDVFDTDFCLLHSPLAKKTQQADFSEAWGKEHVMLINISWEGADIISSCDNHIGLKYF